MLVFVFLILLMACVAVAITVENWQHGLLALAAQYGLGAALLTQDAPAEVVLSFLVGGAIACAILFLTLRQMQDLLKSKRSDTDLEPRSSLADMSYRLAAIVLAGTATYGLSQSYPLPETSVGVTFAIYWLAAAGLFSLSTSQDTLRSGLGLLLIDSATLLLLGATGLGALHTVFLLGIVVNTLVSVSTAYLLTVRSVGSDLD